MLTASLVQSEYTRRQVGGLLFVQETRRSQALEQSVDQQGLQLLPLRRDGVYTLSRQLRLGRHEGTYGVLRLEPSSRRPPVDADLCCGPAGFPAVCQVERQKKELLGLQSLGAIPCQVSDLSGRPPD